MKIFVPDQLSVIRVLRDDDNSKTFVAANHVLERSDVVVKIVRKARLNDDRNHLVKQLSWFGGIRHSNVSVIVYAGITTRGDLYYLREYLPDSRLFSVDGLTAIRALTSAVDFLRSKDQIHGAIKPSNIFLDDGSVKLTDPDFKNAGSRNAEEDIRYSAPEVLRGENPTLESDLYSVGAVLYRILTQRNLFDDLSPNHLKAKYIWASPLHIGNLCDVPKAVSDLVMQLLDKNPQRRIAAFGSLTQQIAIDPIPATRAPFVGRELPLDDALGFLGTRPTHGLRALLIEGAPGVGKSRFVEELMIRCALEGQLFLKLCCTPNSTDFHTILQGIREFLANTSPSNRIRRFDLSNLSNLLSEQASEGKTKQNLTLNKTTNDLTGLICSIARHTRLVLAIEDIDKADAATLRLIEQLSFRAPDAPLALILTRRPGQSELKLSTLLESCLGNELRRIFLIPLDSMDSLKLTQFLETSSERHPRLLHLASGNPLFIEEYVGFDKRRTENTPAINEAFDWMVSQIPRDAQTLVEALSLLRKPVEIETLAKICRQDAGNIWTQLNGLEKAGLVRRNGMAIKIAYPALAKLIYATLLPSTRLDLAKRTFELLKNDYNAEDLAYFAFEAEMFKEAASLYKRLANDAFEQQNYQSALTQYEVLQQCERRGRSPFVPADKLNLSRCYQWAGRQTHSRAVCEELLSNQAVRNDPELLSEVYGRLAGIYDKTSALERLRLSRLALECLPPNSPQIGLRYATLSSQFLEAGNLCAALEALDRAKESVLSDKDSALLDMCCGALLINRGDFRRAAECFLKADRRYIVTAIALNNVALSFENLGDLKRALQFQSEAHTVAMANGPRLIQILSLNNLGSIKTKLGEMRKAERFFADALKSVEQLRTKEKDFDIARLVVVYCDAALHSLQLGKYQRAAEYLRIVRPSAGSVYELDRVYCRIVQCLFYSRIGVGRRVRLLLAQLERSQTFQTPFFQVERRLLEAKIPDVSIEDKLRSLRDALKTTHELHTLYQQCQVQNELAAVLLSADEKQKAQESAKSALRLARKQGYKPLAARALLLAGLASDKQNDKQHKLIAAYQSSSEMGLLELVAESAFHLGMLHLESGNLVTAREYLLRSVSITDSLANEIPVRSRAKYLSMPWRRDARKGLERCNLTIQQQPSSAVPGSSEMFGEDRYFKAVYRLALSAAAIKSAEALVTLIDETLRTALSRGAIIILKDPTATITRALRVKPTGEVIQRVCAVAAMAKNRIYFGSAEMTRQKETVAWIPLQSETREGGLYVVCRQHEPPLAEKEMELLAIIGTIGNGALRGLDTNNAHEIENTQLAEFHGMIGASKAIREVYSQVQIAARNAATVLIEGESGTGKELVAKAIHAAGPRAKEPFIAVDCGAIPEALIEAELFGAKKGSYTGALADRPGLFEAAHRGTIFLDEISNTSTALQAKLLRVVQEREVRRIGETKDRPIDVRLVVASNMNLETLATEGRFRKDLLYRLKVLHIKLPPLRSRREDVPMLAQAFLQRLNAANRLKKYFAPGVLNHLTSQNFPGNVRELQNAIERAFFLANGSVISEIPLESEVKLMDLDEVESWFKDLSEGRKDFWSAVHNRYKRRDISREKVLALVDLGLRSTRGSYKILASRLNLKERDYRRFMDFLRRNDCLLDFRPYRKTSAEAQ